MARKKIKNPKSYRGKLYRQAKNIGYEKSYISSTIQELQEYINQNRRLLHPNIQHGDLQDFLLNDLEGDYDPFFNEETIDYIDITEFLRDLRNTKGFNRHFRYLLVINDGEIIYTLSPNFLDRIFEAFDSNNENYYKEIKIEDIYSIILRKEPYIMFTIPGGAFIPYKLTNYVMNNIAINDFNILNNYWERYTAKPDVDCFGNCIELAENENKIPKGSFNKYSSFRLDNCKIYDLRQKDLSYLSTLLNIKLVIHNYTGNNKEYGDNKQELHLYHFMEHYCLYERTIFTKWSITEGYNKENYNKVLTKKQGKKERHIYNTVEKNGKLTIDNQQSRYMMSIDFIKFMINNSQLTEEMTQEEKLGKIRYNYKIDHNSNINNGFIDNNLEENSKYKIKALSPFFLRKKWGKKNEFIPDSDKYNRIWFDFEACFGKKTYLAPKGNKKINNNKKRKIYIPHLPDTLVVKWFNEETNEYETKKYISNLIEDEMLPAEKFLNQLSLGYFGKEKNHILIAHNLGYDIKFMEQVPELKISKRMSSSKAKVKNETCWYRNHCIYFKDSLTVIPIKLSEFQEYFGLDNLKYKKGACGYGYFTKETINQEYANIENVAKYVRKNEKDNFYESIIPYINPNNKLEFNHNKHRLDYCIQDVDILVEGYLKQRQYINEHFNEELDFCISIPQISYNYLYNNDCFKNINITTGITQQYLKNFIIGGRCMSRKNKKYYIKNIQDLDANSLYTSAMCRDDFFVPTGPGRKLSNDEIKYFNPQNYSYYYINININKVGINRSFPQIYVKGKGYINNPDKDDIIYTGKIKLEDLINFQKIEYNVLGGLVWDIGNEGNNKIKEVMSNLFQKRIDLKNKGQKSESLIKLTTNAGYGRMIMKAFDTDDKFIYDYKEGEKNHDKYIEFRQRHFNHVKEINELANCVYIKKYKTIYGHENYSHFGINVLDMSKRIMNEVMCLAEDNNIKIFYQDTDSMHLLDEDVDNLTKLFKEKYGKDLIGKQLQQFCTDFDVPIGYEKPIAIESIIVGKKCYLDVIKSTKMNNEKLYEKYGNDKLEKLLNNPNENISYHFTMKGIPQQSVLSYCEKNNITLLDLYNKLKNGDKCRFDMLADNGCSFKFNSVGKVYSHFQFSRDIVFKNKINIPKDEVYSSESDYTEETFEEILEETF